MSRFRIPFGSPAPREDAAVIRAAIERVVSSGWYVLCLLYTSDAADE